MSQHISPTDLELAALISSKICHDVIGPVGAICNGLEILDEDDDDQSRSYALEVIRNVTQQASARLQFARFAFGAAGSAGAEIDLDTARQISELYIGASHKHALVWHGAAGRLPKNRVKLLLNMIAIGQTALPRGGDIEVSVSSSPLSLSFDVTCTGRGVRPPQFLDELLSDGPVPEIDAMSIQAYYAIRLSEGVNMPLSVEPLADGIRITAKAVSRRSGRRSSAKSPAGIR